MHEALPVGLPVLRFLNRNDIHEARFPAVLPFNGLLQFDDESLGHGRTLTYQPPPRITAVSERRLFLEPSASPLSAKAGCRFPECALPQQRQGPHGHEFPHLGCEQRLHQTALSVPGGYPWKGVSNWPDGALDDDAAIAYAELRGYSATVLKVPGFTRLWQVSCSIFGFKGLLFAARRLGAG